MNDYKMCNNRIHKFPFPSECPVTAHDDCDESFTNALQDQEQSEGVLKTFPPCEFCFPKKVVSK